MLPAFLSALLALHALLVAPAAGQAQRQVEPAPGAEQELYLQVSTAEDLLFQSFHADVRRLGVATAVALSDDGTVKGDVPYDGIFQGYLQGPYARYVSVQLWGVTLEGDEVDLYSGVVITRNPRVAQLGFKVTRTGFGYEAHRVPIAAPGSIADVVGGMPLVVAFGWGLFLLVYVASLVVARGREKA